MSQPLDPSDERDQWAVAAVLADGDTAFIRPITRADAPLLLAFHEAQPRDDLYLRFFSAKPSLTERELAHFTDVDFHDRVALVMEEHGEFIAWASYERWPGRNDADVAFMVDHRHRGRGIATLLLEHLAAIARSNGIERFTAEVLYENKAMLSVLARAGWPIERHFDSGVTELTFPLGDTAAFIESLEQREHRADSSAITRLLLPRTIAVIGASDTPGTPGEELWRNVSTSFDGPSYPVNPKRQTVAGQRAYPSVIDIDDDVWLAIIAVPAAELVGVIEACIAKRVRGAVVVTAVDGTGIDVEALVQRSRRHGLRIIGPASMGIASPRPRNRLQSALVDVDLPSGGVAISMQSGSLGASLLRLAAELSLGVSWFVSLGDKCDVSANDLLQFWEDDERTTVIALYTESFGKPAKFARIARRVARRRPIVAVRSGSAAVGPGTRALYRQTGIIEVPGVRAMLDTVRVLATQPVPRGPRVAVLTNSRSPGVLARAALGDAGLTVVKPPVELDFTATPADFASALHAALADGGTDAVVVIHAPVLATSVGPARQIDEVARAAAAASKPIVAVMLGYDDGPLLPGSAVPTFLFPENAAAVLGRMWEHAQWLDEEHELDRDAMTDAGASEVVAATIHAAVTEQRTVLDHDEAWRVLGSHGLRCAPMRVVHGDVDTAVAAADELGYPVAVKAEHRRPGRSAAAGVALDLGGPAAVADSVEVMRASLGSGAEQLIVQSMVDPGVDVRVRCRADRQLGMVVTVGPGSLQADDDPGAGRLAPVTRAGATAMVEASALAEALAAAQLSIEPVVEAIVSVARLGADHPELDEIDVNPLIVGHTGGWVTDAHVTIGRDAPVAPAIRGLG